MKLMERNYASQFAKSHPTSEDLEATVRLWCHAFADVEPELLLKAVYRHAEKSEFMPSIASVFKNLHPDPQDHGLPSVIAAFDNGCKEAGKHANIRDWLHPVVWKAVSMTGYVEMRGAQPNGKEFKVFEQNYRAACGRYMNGEIFEVPEDQRLTFKKEKTATKNEALSHLSRLKKDLE